MGGGTIIMNQDHWRLHIDNTGDNPQTARFVNQEDESFAVALLDVPLWIRMKHSNVGTKNNNQAIIRMYYNINGNGWTQPTSGGNGVVCAVPEGDLVGADPYVKTFLTNGTNVTSERLTAVGGTTFVNGEVEANNAAITISFAAGTSREEIFVMMIKSNPVLSSQDIAIGNTAVKAGDGVQMRFQWDGNAYDNYFSGPQFIVAEPIEYYQRGRKRNPTTMRM
jgi:hypothetical protein